MFDELSCAWSASCPDLPLHDVHMQIHAHTHPLTNHLPAPPHTHTLMYRTRLLRSNPRLVLPVQAVVATLCFGLALPVAISLFPQKSQVRERGLVSCVVRSMTAQEWREDHFSIRVCSVCECCALTINCVMCRTDHRCLKLYSV